MDAELRARFDARRDLGDKPFESACYAPFTNLYFDQSGNVRACCFNNGHLLGNVRAERLAEIWHGRASSELRTSVRAYDFARGCQFCAWQVDEGNLDGTHAADFEHFPVDSAVPAWPAQMEFSMSNTCNLECIMCSGQFSSAIRSRREGLPPLERAYDDRFFEDLRSFLPHLAQAKFLGGEPFLTAESFRIWDLMIDASLEIACHVTTNGTQWTPRVRRVLDNLPVSFAVSMDGLSRATVESIRVGVDHAQLMKNFAQYHAYAAERGTWVSLTFCLMRPNWHELGDFLLFGDDWDCDVFVNTVFTPVALSLHHTPLDELTEIVEHLRDQDEQIGPRLGRNRAVWDREVQRIEHRLRARQATTAAPSGESTGHETSIYSLSRPFLRSAPPPDVDDLDSRARAGLEAAEADIDELVCDLQDRIVSVGSRDRGFLGLSIDECVGRRFDEILNALEGRFASRAQLVSQTMTDHLVTRLILYPSPDQPSLVRVATLPRWDDDGHLIGTRLLASRRPGSHASSTDPSPV